MHANWKLRVRVPFAFERQRRWAAGQSVLQRGAQPVQIGERTGDRARSPPLTLAGHARVLTTMRDYGLEGMVEAESAATMFSPKSARNADSIAAPKARIPI